MDRSATFSRTMVVVMVVVGALGENFEKSVGPESQRRNQASDERIQRTCHALR